ncbi:hypothetical protein QZH41_005524 [Actinostola sp. cb2023]|nr:hypothetical protein QZH41_005524 [Actinostola sp. cb2023]
MCVVSKRHVYHPPPNQVYKSDCELKGLNDDDFESFLRLCLTSDVILIGDKGYTQKTGLAMGNNLAPALAIIYMNEIDIQILCQFQDKALMSLKRYIDDIFIAWMSDGITAEEILSTANSLNTALKFTIEMPQDNQLPFLDTMVSLDHESDHSLPHYMSSPYIASVLYRGIVMAPYHPRELF